MKKLLSKIKALFCKKNVSNYKNCHVKREV